MNSSKDLLKALQPFAKSVEVKGIDTYVLTPQGYVTVREDDKGTAVVLTLGVELEQAESVVDFLKAVNAVKEPVVDEPKSKPKSK